MVVIEPFHTLLANAFRFYDLDCSKAAQVIEAKKSIRIADRTMRDYLRGRIVPPYLKAKDILETFGYNFTEEEIKSALAQTKNLKETQNYDQITYGVIRKSVRIRCNELVNGLDASEAEVILNERIDNLFGTPEALVDYINLLIKQDLDKYLTIKGDEQEGE